MHLFGRSAASVLNRLGLGSVILFGFLLLAPALFGSPLPTCTSASLSVYDTGGYECTLGQFTLDDFTFSSSETGEANLLPDTAITVNPTGSTPTTISMQFSTPGGFTVGTGQTAEYIVQYNMDPVLPVVTSASIDLGPNDPVTLTGEFCGNGMLYSAPNNNASVEPMCLGNDPSGIFPGKLQISGTASSPDSFSFPPASNVNTLDTRLILDLTGPAEVDSFGSIADVTFGGPTSAVPEPSSSWLMIPVLLAYVWVRKKRLTAGR
jgi:hypothetical protein